MKGKKKVIIIIVAVVVVLALLAGGLFFALKKGLFGNKSTGSSADRVYVERVGSIINSNYGAASSYSGKVETQETLEIKKDGDKEIAELLVHEGDEVEVGTPLFVYDTTSIEQQIQTAQLDLEGYGYTITSLNNQIADLQKEKSAAPADQQYEYSMQIAQLQAQIRQAQYDQQAKQNEISNLQKQIQSATVTSTMAGIIQEINESDEAMYGSAAYITVLAIGDYRIKCSIDEQSFYYGEIYVGQPVIVRSRVDETQTWSGTISEINTEETATDDSNDYYYYDSSSGESATKYPFYVELEDSTGMTLGQHVFVEPDYGQVEVQEGIWLDEGYIDFADDGYSYVWVANSKNKLEHRKVILGEENPDTYQYQVLDGLTEDDYIAYNMYGLYEGIICVTSYDEIDYSSPLYNQEYEDDNSADYSDDDYYYDDSMDDFGTIDNPIEVDGNPEDYGDLDEWGLTLDEESGYYVDESGYYYFFNGNEVDFGDGDGSEDVEGSEEDSVDDLMEDED